MLERVYVEREALGYPVCEEVIGKLKNSRIILIDDYKEVFSRANQNFRLQKENPAIILAVNKGKFIYKGAENCQDFGQKDFYYCSCAKNCTFCCDYCYLQGMYRSGNIVVFVNQEDCFRETERLLEEKGGLYLCLSYDSDLFAMEGLLGYVKRWNDFARIQRGKGFLCEIRTKSAPKDFFQENRPSDNMIFAWTVSPDPIIKATEKRTATLDARLDAAAFAAGKGFQVRLCLDPIIDMGDGMTEQHYRELGEKIKARGLGKLLHSASAGPFRVPAEYIKLFKKNAPQSPISWRGYEVRKGTADYGEERIKELNEMAEKILTDAEIPKEKIYCWEGK